MQRPASLGTAHFAGESDEKNVVKQKYTKSTEEDMMEVMELGMLPLSKCYGFKMNKETYKEMVSTLMNVMSNDDDGTLVEAQAKASEKEVSQQDVKDVDDDLYGTDEPGKPVATDATPKGEKVPTAAEEAKPAMVSVESQAGTTDTPPPSQPGQNNPFQCIQCPRTFENIADYNNHVALHNRMRESRYICDICNKGFRSFERMAVHFDSYHAHPLIHTCSQCRQTFDTERLLTIHRREYHHFSSRCHPRIMTAFQINEIIAQFERDADPILEDRLRLRAEARSRINTAHGNGSRSGNVGTLNAENSNAGNANAGTRNSGTRNAWARSTGTHNVGTRNSRTRNAGARSSGTRNARTRNARTRNVETASAGTSNVETSNTGTSNTGPSNAGISSAVTSNAEINKLGIVKVDLVNPGTAEVFNMDIDNVAAANVEIANTGTANAETANAETTNDETTNDETANAGIAEIDKAETAAGNDTQIMCIL